MGCYGKLIFQALDDIKNTPVAEEWALAKNAVATIPHRQAELEEREGALKQQVADLEKQRLHLQEQTDAWQTEKQAIQQQADDANAKAALLQARIDTGERKKADQQRIEAAAKVQQEIDEKDNPEFVERVRIREQRRAS
jgi:chromosome segregation ATPase